MSGQVINIFQGSTFVFSTECLQDDGTPFDLTGMTIKSQVRDQEGMLIADLVPSIVDAENGLWQIEPVSTDAWPLKILLQNALYIRAGIKEHDEIHAIHVCQPPTRDV